MSPLVRRIRRCVVVAAFLGVAAGIVGMFPGERYYADSSNCASMIFATEGHHGGGCEARFDREVGESRAGGFPLIVFIALALAYGAWLYRDPSRVGAIAWTGFAMIAGVVWVLATFNLGHMFDHIETLPAQRLTYTLFGGMIACIFPFAFVAGIVGDRGKRTDEATARVVS